MKITHEITNKQKMIFILFIIVALANFLFLSDEKEQSPVYVLPIASMAKEAGH